MQRFRQRALVGFLVPPLVASLAGCASQPVRQSWVVDDQVVDFDPFPGMNVQGRNVTLTQDEINGRVIWNLWSGDNAGFWNWLAQYGFGTGDLLKMIASPRNQRFQTYGVVNQPGFMRPAQPDEYGLYLDVPREAGSKYDIDERLDLATYGRSSGVMGLRLFENPKFDREKWNAEDYWNDPNYSTNPALERPYMVGMACSFCHVGPDPVNPPADPNEPDFANLSDYVGQHYMKVWEVFGHDLGPDNFIKQLLMTNPAGTLDTSFISTDYLNNPGTMNGIYNLSPPGRAAVAVPEKISGGARDLTIRVKDAQRLSPAWNWSEEAAPDLAAYLTRFARPHKLADAPGGAEYLITDQAQLDRGKVVFAQSCARCHSSKRPPQGVDAKSPEGRAWFEQAVMENDFLDGNFLASEERIPITEVRTNATRAVATNALAGRIWDNFSSETYKNLPPVGAIDVWNPIEDVDSKWKVPSPGRGYYRPASLVSVWASAPLLHNNALGKHVHGVSVAERMEAFDDAITKLLWPENRAGAVGNTDGADGQSTSLWLTTEESSVRLPESYIDSSALRRLLRNHMEEDERTGARYFSFGPIPQGTPVNLLANTNFELGGVRKARDLARLLIDSVKVMKDIERQGLTGEAATKRWLESTVVKELYGLSSCPDFIEDRGHYFGTDLPDADKRALIEYVKTF